MSVKKIFLIYKPSPTIGRSPLHGAGGGLFGFYKENDYIAALKNKLKAENIDWLAEIDNTDSDIEKLIEQNATVLVCAPGLRFQFYRNGFDKKNIIYLSTMEYVNNNVIPVINKVKEIDNEKRA